MHQCVQERFVLKKSSRIVLCQEIICALFLKLAAGHKKCVLRVQVKLRVCNQGWLCSHICAVVSKRRLGDMRGSAVLRAFWHIGTH